MGVPNKYVGHPRFCLRLKGYNKCYTLFVS